MPGPRHRSAWCLCLRVGARRRRRDRARSASAPAPLKSRVTAIARLRSRSRRELVPPFSRPPTTLSPFRCGCRRCFVPPVSRITTVSPLRPKYTRQPGPCRFRYSSIPPLPSFSRSRYCRALRQRALENEDVSSRLSPGALGGRLFLLTINPARTGKRLMLDLDTVESVAHVIQVALAPVFLLSGIASLLGVLSTRLARVADRVDALAEQLEADGGDRAAAQSLWAAPGDRTRQPGSDTSWREGEAARASGRQRPLRSPGP